jgi:signal-transduction protein with cAMP-binding, CBS, and nucleotidyltransferase domain
MNEEKARIAALLTREYPFQSLTPEQLIALADKFDIKTVKEGEILVGPKTIVDNFYILYTGKLQSETAVRRHDARINILGPGDYFGDELLLTGSAPPTTVKAWRKHNSIRCWMNIQKSAPYSSTRCTAAGRGVPLASPGYLRTKWYISLPGNTSSS